MSTLTQLPLPLPDMTFEIQLTQGQVALVSATFADLALLKWSAHLRKDYGNGGAYLAIRNSPTVNGKKTTIYMHRVILSRVLGRELLTHEQVDHINLDPLCNTVENLRLANGSQNQANQSRRKDNSSGFKGVYWDKRGEKWVARVCLNGKAIYLGSFDTPEEAHAAYCVAAGKYHGEFARFE